MTIESVITFALPMIKVRSYDTNNIGPWPAGNSMTWGRSRLPTEPIGVVNIILTNVIVGSNYRIERQSDGSLVDIGTAATSTVNLTLDYYSVGNTLNNIKIKVRKGSSAPYYKDLDSLLTLSSSDQSVYIAQIPD